MAGPGPAKGRPAAHIGRPSGQGVPSETRDERGRTLSEADTLGQPSGAQPDFPSEGGPEIGD